MTRYTKDAHGKYVIHGKKYEMLVGSRAQVHHGTAYKTSGGLKHHEILQNKNGRMVSRLKHTTAKKERRLAKHGWTAKKGHFGPVRMGSHASTSRKSRRMRGGSSHYNRGGMGSVGASSYSAV